MRKFKLFKLDVHPVRGFVADPTPTPPKAVNKPRKAVATAAGSGAPKSGSGNDFFFGATVPAPVEPPVAAPEPTKAERKAARAAAYRQNWEQMKALGYSPVPLYLPGERTRAGRTGPSPLASPDGRRVMDRQTFALA